jgi:hypothetical protein
MRLWMILTVLLGGFLGSRSAFAAKAATLDKQAMKACLSGDYAKGVSILTDLYLETHDATYLYNQGRCYEQNVRYVEAAERFREYLRKATKLGKKDREETEKHIADCEAAIAKSHPVEPAQPLPPPPEPTPPPPQPLPLVVQAAQPAPPAAEGRTWLHTAKWVAAGAAVAFLGLGVVEHVRYYGKNKDYNDNSSCPNGDGCKSLSDSADTAQVMAFVGYGAAAVATGLAVTFFLVDKPSSPAGQRAGLGITCAPALAGVSCAGRF